MVALSDLTFLARGLAGGIKNVAGSAVTVALATLAEGLQKADDILIDAQKATDTIVSVQNTGLGAVIFRVFGAVEAFGAAAFDGIVSTNAGFDINDGVDQGRFRVANLTADRTYTFPDADVTIGAGSNYLGSKTSAQFNAITPSGFAWGFCNDIAGSAGGTTGVPVYYTPVTGVWLRYATDGTI